MSNNSVLKGELIEHGTDCYLHDPAKSMNYFAKIRLENGTTTERWSKNLEEVIKNSGVKTGDTIVLTELGKEPIQIGDRAFNKTLWDLQRYEPAQNFLNVIENDSERQKQKQTDIANTDKTKEGEQELNTPNQSNKNSDWDFELPENIKNNYIAITKNRYLLDQRTNYYDKDDKEQVNIAFEDHNNSLHTSRQDEKTIYAMLDMAQAKNWTAIKIKGAEEFKQKAWLEASLRGIEIKGYTPTEKDLAELQAKQAQRTTNQMEMTAQKTPEIQNVEQLTIQNNRFNFEPMTAEDVGKSAEDIKKDIRQIFQTGYKDGSIKSRDELVEVLKERGFEVKENDKSIRVSLPNSDQAVNLKGEVFTKGYDAIKSLKERLEPETLKQTYPTLKDSDIVHITAYKNKIFEDNKGGSPQILQASLVQLEDGIKSMVKGKEMNLPNLPINEIKPDIEVRTTENHDKSRQI